MTQPVFCPLCGAPDTSASKQINSYDLLCVNCKSKLSITDQTGMYNEQFFNTVKDIRNYVNSFLYASLVIDTWDAETT